MAKLPNNVRVFITGGGSGLGRALAVALAPRKARILLGDINLAGAEETAEMVRKAGGTAETIMCDVGKSLEMEAAAERMMELWGGTDLLVNNAGVAVAGTIGDIALKDWTWIMKINLWGPIYGCHHFAPQMRKQGRGWILNVASNAGITTLPEMSPYNVTKAGVIALSETLYTELSGDNIKVSVLCPTFFQTNLMSTFRSSDERQRHLAEQMFKRSLCDVDHVAKVALRDMQKGKLYIIPQADGRFTWKSKRLSPQFFYDQIGRGYRKGALNLLARKKGK